MSQWHLFEGDPTSLSIFLTIFSNAVQLISALLLLRARLTGLVHLTLMGSIFSNLLLMTGLCFLLGGVHPRRQQRFNADLAQTMGMLLLLATLSLVIPTASRQLTTITFSQVTLQSRGTAITILVSYGLWLWFQLGPDRELFETTMQQIPKSKTGLQTANDAKVSSIEKEISTAHSATELKKRRKSTGIPTEQEKVENDSDDLNNRAGGSSKSASNDEKELQETATSRESVDIQALSIADTLLQAQAAQLATAHLCSFGSTIVTCFGSPESVSACWTLSRGETFTRWLEQNPHRGIRSWSTKYHVYQAAYKVLEERERPKLDVHIAMMFIMLATVLIGFNTEFATNSIQGLLENTHLTQYFVGLIILPLLSLEPASITYARLDRLNLSISLTLDRCMQTALMVIPLVVLLAWALGIPNMTLQFDSFTVVAVFVSIVIVTYVVQEGKSNWYFIYRTS